MTTPQLGAGSGEGQNKSSKSMYCRSETDGLSPPLIRTLALK